MTQSAEILFLLLRSGLTPRGLTPSSLTPNPSPEGEGSASIDWKEVIDLSFEQGVAAIAVDGINAIASSTVQNVQVAQSFAKLDAPELEDMKFEWFGEQMLCEQEYSAYRKAIFDLADFYNKHGLKMLLLKGYGLSLNYPVPEHRPVGDIDIYLTSPSPGGEGVLQAWKMGDDAIEKELEIEVDSSHEHHTIFQFEGFTVENHYDIINTKGTRTAKLIDEKLKTILLNEHESHESNIYLPSATFNAIFLIRHLGQHMAGEKVTLRHLLDWGLFLEKQSSMVDWEFVLSYWKEMGIYKFACAINAVCKKYLGFEDQIFHGALLAEDDTLVARLMNDIISPEFKAVMPESGIIRTSLWKTRRFFANGWKRRLVYKENLLEAFVTGSLAKIKRHDYR